MYKGRHGRKAELRGRCWWLWDRGRKGMEIGKKEEI
jgi:hypothetical protein